MDLSRAVYSRDLKIVAMRALDAGSATSACRASLHGGIRGFGYLARKHFHYIFEMTPIQPSQRLIPALTQLLGR